MALKYKVGDRVKIKSFDWYNENKDEDGIVELSTSVFTPGMSQFCGKVMTISHVGVDYYTMVEDLVGYWTDEMIEGIAEEKYQPKFNIGDVVYSKTWQRNVVIIEILPDGFYAVGELYGTGCTGWFKTHEDNLCKDIVKLNNPTYDNMVEELMENKNNHLTETVVDTVRESNDRYRIVTDPRFDIEVDEGEYYAVRRKNEYPKTYEECCRVLGVSEFEYNHTATNVWYRHKLMATLDNLMLCRDAYWKLYGEEMGLGKPWEPDWGSFSEGSYPTITKCNDRIVKTSIYTHDCILVFPTEEIRDAFKENFNPNIEICKELL